MGKTNMIGTTDQITVGTEPLIDYQMSLYIEINDVSENLQAKINQAVEESKKENEEMIQHFCNRGWKETKIRSLTLLVKIRKHKPITTSILIFFEEIENSDNFSSAFLPIDLSAFELELKALIGKKIINTLL